MTINIDDGLLVIHAMDIRPKYRDRYDPDDLAAMRTRGRPTPDTTAGKSRAVSVRMNPELLSELHAAAAARHVPISTLIREATAQWLHHHAS